jgi:hypothetical protein
VEVQAVPHSLLFPFPILECDLRAKPPFPLEIPSELSSCEFTIIKDCFPDGWAYSYSDPVLSQFLLGFGPCVLIVLYRYQTVHTPI